jgi:acetate kinase
MRKRSASSPRTGSPCVLTINGGSSSIRFAVYEAGASLRRRLAGKIDRVGLSGTA